MADMGKVIRNLNKMIEQGAPQDDTDAYLKSEGVTIDQVRSNAKMVLGNPRAIENIPSDPTAGMSKMEKLKAGSGKWFTDRARGVKQLPLEVAGAVPGDPFGARPSMYEARKDEAERRKTDAPLMSTPEGKTGYIGTGMGTDLLGAVLTRQTPAFGLFAPQNFRDAGAYGLIRGVMDPATSPEDRLKNAGMSTAAGAVGQIPGVLAARAASPVVASDASRTLSQHGINPTPGQSVDPTSIPGKMFRNMEERLTSVPIVGDIVGSVRDRARTQLHQASLARAGGVNGEMGHQGVAAVDDRLGNQFDNIYAQGGNMTPDGQLFTDLANTAQRTPMLPEQQGILLRHLDLILNRRGRGNPIPGEELGRIRSEWNSRARGLANSNNDTERQLGLALQDAVEAVDNYFERTAGQNLAGQLAQVRNQYMHLARVEGAVAKAAKNEQAGIPTPSQYMDSVTQQAQGMKRKTIAAGEAVDQDLATAGMQLKDTRPNSGTPERMLMDRLINGSLFAGAGLGAGYAGEQAGLPFWLMPALMGTGAAATYGVPAVNRYMAGNYGWQPAWEAALRQSVRPAGSQGVLWDQAKERK
jgi:hypothetical protein